MNYCRLKDISEYNLLKFLSLDTYFSFIYLKVTLDVSIIHKQKKEKKEID